MLDHPTAPETTVSRLRSENWPLLDRIASEYSHLNYSTALSDQDAMLSGNEKGYFGTGLAGLHAINQALYCANRHVSEMQRILDFGCGYGRVLRMLRAASPNGEITASDRVQAAVDFCATEFGAKPHLSDKPFAELRLPESYDLIWLGSVFTHLDCDDFISLLALMERHLNPRGVLVFTVAGRFVVRLIEHGDTEQITRLGAESMLAHYHSTGFGFALAAGEQSRRWGRTVVKPSWVTGLLDTFDTLRLVSYTERGWGGRQDVVAWMRDP